MLTPGKLDNGQWDRDWFYIEYHDKHRTLRDIGPELGISAERVRQIVKGFGIPYVRKPQYEEAWLREQILKKRTRAEIADECGVGVKTITKWCHALGIRRIPYTARENMDRSNAAHKRRYANEPEYRKHMIARTRQWYNDNKEQATLYQHNYYRDRHPKP